MKQTNIILPVGGMSCAHCELTIEEVLQKLQGVSKCSANFGKGQVNVTFDEGVTTLGEIKTAINNAGYTCVDEDEKSQGESIYSPGESIHSPREKRHSQGEKGDSTGEKGQILYILIILLGGYVILKHLGLLNIFNFFPTIQTNAGYGMLFIIGLLTSLHCVAMCGGINIAQSVNSSDKISSPFIPNILYNLGRVISYTIVGGIVGGIGAVVNPGGGFRGIVAIFAGVFMIIMGLNMLNIFPGLRRFNLKMPKFISKRISKKKNTSKSSLYIGILNGLMPCGPLQSMQLYALSTGSIIAGAFSMFLFSLGTVPLMFILGALSSKINKKFTEKMFSICALLVVILGVGMLNNGLALSGVSMPSLTNSQATSNETVVTKDIQTITTPLDYGRYPTLVVKNNIPVKWTITAEKGVINGCNNEIIIPEYNLAVQLKEGENIIEFTPTKTGTFTYSCWMGMIRSSITVTN